MNAPVLAKRFYKKAGIAQSDGRWAVQLDGRPVRTPARAELAFAERALAEAVAAEWDAQGEQVDPRTMPLTRLVNSALDGVAGREREVNDDICSYAGTDLVCYRAAQPRELVALQARHWDPVLEWSTEALGARFVLAEGIIHQAQPETSLAHVRAALKGYDPVALAALHVITTMTGSALLALALARGHLTADQVWTAAHVDEDWQISQWGEDAEAAARRAVRRIDFDAAVRALNLGGPAAE